MNKQEKYAIRQIAVEVVRLHIILGLDVKNLASSDAAIGSNLPLTGVSDDIDGLRLPLLELLHDRDSLRRESQGRGMPEQNLRVIAKDMTNLANSSGYTGQLYARDVIRKRRPAYSALEAAQDMSAVFSSVKALVDEHNRLMSELERLRALTELDAMSPHELDKLYRVYQDSEGKQ